MIYEPPRKTSDFAYLPSYICMHIFHHTFTCKKKEMKEVEGTERRGNTGPIHESKRQASVNRLDCTKRQMSCQPEEKNQYGSEFRQTCSVRELPWKQLHRLAVMGRVCKKVRDDYEKKIIYREIKAEEDVWQAVLKVQIRCGTVNLKTKKVRRPHTRFCVTQHAFA